LNWTNLSQLLPQYCRDSWNN